jgi:hypothetical protein
VGGTVDPAVFIQEFLSSFLESRLLQGDLSTDEYHDQQSALRKDGLLAALSQRLFESSPEPVDFKRYGPLRLIYLREPDGSEFPFLQGLIRNGSPSPRKLTCFVGHRFLADIEKSLRFNLVHLLEPYGIHLRWSGYDLSARDVFDDVVSGIRHADLCVFDNLGILNRPNVYIEIGIAHALGIPMLVCEYAGKAKRVPDTGSVPSDLQGLLRIQYRSYQDLSRQLHFRLPAFLRENVFRRSSEIP